MKLLSLETATTDFPTIFRLSECLQTHAPFMSIKSIFNPDWLRYNLRNEFGYVARPVPNSIHNFFPFININLSYSGIRLRPISGIYDGSFLAISDHMSRAYRHWQLPSPINFLNFYSLVSPRFNTCVPDIH